MPLTRRGDQGPAVQILQLLLAVAGYPIGTPDGTFGLATEGQVRAFQRDKNIGVDGIVGPLTWGALAKIQPKVADTSALTAQVQQLGAELSTVNGKLGQIKTIVA